MSHTSERLLTVLAHHETAMRMLTSEERDTLANFNKKIDTLRKEWGTPIDSKDPDKIIFEAFRVIPGSEDAINKQTKLLDDLLMEDSE